MQPMFAGGENALVGLKLVYPMAIPGGIKNLAYSKDQKIIHPMVCLPKGFLLYEAVKGGKQLITLLSLHEIIPIRHRIRSILPHL
jgi:hypothetical protein